MHFKISMTFVSGEKNLPLRTVKLSYHPIFYHILNQTVFDILKVFKVFLSDIKVKQKRKSLNKQNQYCKKYYFCDLIQS